MTADQKVLIRSEDGRFVGRGDGFGDVGLHDSTTWAYVYDTDAHAEQQVKAITRLKGAGFLGAWSLVPLEEVDA